jgi:hypothetical protein
MTVQLAARGGASAVAVNGRMVSVGVAAGYPPADFAMEMFAAFRK